MFNHLEKIGDRDSAIRTNELIDPKRLLYLCHTGGMCDLCEGCCLSAPFNNNPKIWAESVEFWTKFF